MNSTFGVKIFDDFGEKVSENYQMMNHKKHFKMSNLEKCQFGKCILSGMVKLIITLPDFFKDLGQGRTQTKDSWTAQWFVR